MKVITEQPFALAGKPLVGTAFKREKAVEPATLEVDSSAARRFVKKSYLEHCPKIVLIATTCFTNRRL